MYDPQISVLFVDSPLSALKQTRELLGLKENLRVDVVSSVQDACKRLKQETYNTVAFNCALLQKDGLQLLRNLRENGNSTPFIFITAKRQRRKIEPEALNLDVYQYVEITGSAESEAAVLFNAVLNAAKRKRTLDELRASEEKFRAISETAKDGIILIDAQGRIIFWNDFAQKIFGYDTKEVLGKTLDILMPLDRVSLFDEARERMFARLREEGTVAFPGKIVQMPGVRKDGVTVLTEMSMSAMKIGGKWQGLAIVRDVTERKAIEEHVRLLSNIAQQTVEGIAVSDLKGMILFVNSAWLKMHNFNENEEKDLIGQWILQFYCIPQLSFIDRNIKSDGVFRGRITHVRKDGTTFTVLATLSPLKSEDGQAVGIIHVAKNLTDIVRDIRDVKFTTVCITDAQEKTVNQT